MSQPLPTSGFRCVSCNGFDPEVIVNRLSENDKYGYLLEVDVDYPRELHDLHL